MIIYYTGTGSSRYIAHAMSEKLDDDICSANEYIKAGKGEAFTSEVPYIFVFPVYISTIPEVFRSFIMRSEFAGSREAYFIPVCAAASGSAATAAKELCDKKGLVFKGSFTVIMPQNYIACFRMDDQDKIESKLREAEPATDAVCERIRNGEFIESKMSGAFEYGATKLVEKLYNKFFTVTAKFRAEQSCIGCGLCEKNCPVNAIAMKDGRPVWVKKTCIHCMACINRCPAQAIQYGDATRDKVRYVCPMRAQKD